MKQKLSYALGEIIIVIIGISIAFTMNKCAEDSKNNKLKIRYLKSILNDLEEDKSTLEVNADVLGKKIGTIQEVLPLFSATDIKSKNGIKKIFGVMQLVNFNPKNITYRSMINSGDFSLIEDFNIKTAIETHYSDYKTVLKDYERVEILSKQYVGDYFINNVDYDALYRGDTAFKNEKLLKNILHSMRGALIIKLKASERGVKSCDNLIGLISSKLSSS